MTLRKSSGCLARGRHRGADAGVVDQHVDAAELAHRPLDDAARSPRRWRRRPRWPRSGARRPRRPALVCSQPVGAARADGHVGTGLGQALGEGDAQPGRRAGDDRDLTIQAEAVQHAHPGPPTGVCSENGEGGIRTRDRDFSPYSLSRRVPSATRPPLPRRPRSVNDPPQLRARERGAWHHAERDPPA